MNREETEQCIEANLFALTEKRITENQALSNIMGHIEAVVKGIENKYEQR